MTTALPQPIKLFQFPRMFAIPNLSPFCCKLETWLRIARIRYEVVDTPDPRKGPKGKLPFIEDDGVRIADTSLIVDHLKKTRDTDPDARLDARSERSRSSCSARWKSTMPSSSSTPTSFERTAGGIRAEVSMPSRRSFVR
jgi:glutathione S-transferase